MRPSWRFYLDSSPDYAAIYYDQDEAEEFARTIPKDLAYKVVNEHADIVYQREPTYQLIMESYKDGWKDVQSTTHGRKTRYSKVQEQLLPSAIRTSMKARH